MKPRWGYIRRHERGSAVLFIVAWIVFAILALGAWSLFEGRAGLARSKAQFQADAVITAAGVAARVYGPNLICANEYGLPFLEAVHERNEGVDAFTCPFDGVSPVDDDPTRSFGFRTRDRQAVQGRDRDP